MTCCIRDRTNGRSLQENVDESQMLSTLFINDMPDDIRIRRIQFTLFYDCCWDIICPSHMRQYTAKAEQNSDYFVHLLLLAKL